MRKQKSRLISSAFMLVTTLSFTSLCITFAWFTSHLQEEVPQTGLSMTGMFGDLYYYNGNRNDKGEWCGYLPGDTLDKGFTKLDPHLSLTDPNHPFNMNSAIPASRFLFYVDAQVFDTNKETFDVHFEAVQWEAHMINPNAPIPYFNNNGNPENIYLTRAISLYSIDTPIVKTGGVDPVQESYNFSNNLVSSDSLDLFKETTASNADVDANGNPVPKNLKSYIFNKSTSYYIPFIIEFSNNPESYFYHKPGDVKDLYTVPTPDTLQYANSNVYMGMTFKFKTLRFTHIR